jgi:hypothetical protein
MTSQVPMVEPIFGSASFKSKRGQMELSKALAAMGFGSWNDLEPGKKLLQLQP